MMIDIYQFLEENEQYGDDWTEAKAWLKETTVKLARLEAKVAKLEWIENEEEINDYIHEKVSSYKEFQGVYPSWCKYEDWYEEEEEE